MNAYLSIDFASRNAALTAAEAGSNGSADCSILRTIEDSVTAPASSSRHRPGPDLQGRHERQRPRPGQRVRPQRDDVLPAQRRHAGDPAVSRVSNGYPSSSRCDELAGCKVQTSVDTVGIEISTYGWITPLHSLLPTSGPGYTMVKSNAMRMEPVL